MTKLEVLKNELIYKDEECSYFKQRYLSVDFMYSSLGRKAIEGFLKNGHTRVGIYGAGVIGRCLFDCIKGVDANISIEVFDQSGKSDYFSGVNIYLPNDKLPLDAIIVTTPRNLFERIRGDLAKTGYGNIVSLETVLHGQNTEGAINSQHSHNKKMVYLFDTGYKGFIGLRRKALMQTKAFCDLGYESYLLSRVNDMIEIYDYNNDAYDFIGFGSTAEYYEIILEFIKRVNPEIFYIRRRPFIDYFVMDFYKSARESLPGAKMVLEVPSLNEMQGMSYEKYADIDRYYKRQVIKFFDCSTNFNDLDVVFGIKSVKMLNGIDLDAIKIKNTAHKDEKRINLATAAGMGLYNGFERLIDGIKAYYENDYAANGYKVYFYLAGEGLTLGLYKKLAKEYNLEEYIKFCGVLDGAALDNFYNMADFGILPLGLYKQNLNFAGCIRLCEFCAKGLPIIYAGQMPTSCPPIPYTLEFPNDDSVIDIKKIIAHYEKLREFPEHVKELRQYAENNFGWSVFINRLLTAIG